MNFSKKGIVVMILLVLAGTMVTAQNNEFSITPTLGIGTPVLDNGIGWHIGVNPSLSFSPYLAVEGQVSYINTKITGTFLSGRIGRTHAVNTLVLSLIHI